MNIVYVFQFMQTVSDRCKYICLLLYSLHLFYWQHGEMSQLNSNKTHAIIANKFTHKVIAKR